MTQPLSIIADVHVGNHRVAGGVSTGGINQRCREILTALEAAQRLAINNRSGLVVAGDLFDYTRPEPPVMAQVISIFNDTSAPYMIPGNHDMVSNAPGDHTLAPLEQAGVADVQQCHTGIRYWGEWTLLLCPFMPGDAREWFPAQMQRFQGKHLGRHAVIVSHFGIIDERTAPWLKDARDAIPVELAFKAMRSVGAKYLVVGNWHEHKSWQHDGMTIIQVGALVPTGFDNCGDSLYGSVITLDLDNNTWKRYRVPGPRFFSLVRPEVSDCMAEARQLLSDHSSPYASKLYLRVQVPLAQVDAMREAFERISDEDSDQSFWVDVRPIVTAVKQAEYVPPSNMDLLGALLSYMNVNKIEGTTKDMARDIYDRVQRGE